MRSMIIALALAAGFAPAIAQACPLMQQNATTTTQTVAQDSATKEKKG